MMDSNNNTNQQFHHHYNFQSNQQQQHQQQQQQTFKLKPAVEENSSLDAFLESPQFLTDIYIKSLIDKGITLGIVWEAIKETLGRFLINIMNNNSLDLDINGINYSRLIDEEKFFEQLILYSIQVENSNNNKLQHGSNKNEFGDDYNENDEDDYETTNETTDQQQANEHEFELSQQFNRINMNTETTKTINRPPVISSNLNTMAAAVAKKQTNMQQMPLTAQQKIQQEQDFITQSINRINDKSNLRPIIVDSNDVALSSHSNKQVFLFSRIKQVVDYFEKRNHQIYVILSSWRKEQIMTSPLSNSSSSLSNSVQNTTQQASNTSQQQQQQQQQPLTPDQQALIEMEQKNQVYYTPSKRVGAKRIVCDDDSYMLKLCVAKMGIIVSNDNFKRFLNYSDDFKLVIEERVLMYSFIDNTFMPAEDPLGKNGPSLDNFLRFESFVNQQYMKRCPYRKKCTYGSKCKFWHPERGLHQGHQLFKTAHQSVLDEAQEQKMRLEIILNKNSYSNSNIVSNQQHQSIYSVDNETNENDDEHNDENSIKLLNKIKQQKHQYSGLMNSANIYNLHEFDSMKNSEQTWVIKNSFL
jgi:ribonuclease ZC3H12